MQFRISKEEFSSAMFLSSSQQLRGRPAVLIYVALGLGLIGYTAIQYWSSGRLIPKVAEAAVIYLVIFALLVFVVPHVLAPALTAYQWRKNPSLQDDYSVEVSGDGITVEGEAGRWTTLWRNALRLDQNDAVMLVYVGSGLFQVLPKRVLSTGDIRLIEANIRAGLRPK